MKTLFILSVYFLPITSFAQHMVDEAKSTGKTAVELILANHRIDASGGWEKYRKLPSGEIETEFDFTSYYSTNNDLLFKEDTMANVLVSKKEILLAENYLQNTNVSIVSVKKCVFKDVDTHIENAYCLMVKEEKRYFFEDNLISIHTTYNCYWYCGFFKNYLSRYSRSILNSPEGLVIHYSENISKNPLSYLEQNFSNRGSQAMTVYPNPASQYLTIQYIGYEGQENTFELIDTTEKTVKKIKTTGSNGLNSVKIEVSSYAKGFYILKGTINKQFHSAKIILE